MIRGCYTNVLRVAAIGTVLLVGSISGAAAGASPVIAKQAAAGSGAGGMNMTPAATNCGNGVSYRPARGQAMTAADFAALGIPVPSGRSPLTMPGTHWVVPQCAAMPAGKQPGGPSAGSAPAVPSGTGARPAASAQMQSSPNWTGFQSNGGGPYSQAFSEWTIPSSFPIPPGNTYESSWAGLGSGNSAKDALFQAGTETDVTTSGVVSNFAWWEFYPMNAAQKIKNFPIRSGSVNYAQVSHTGYGKGLVQLCTQPPGQSSFTCIAPITALWGTAYAIGSSQFECIAERPLIGGYWNRLTNITGVNFYDCSGYTNTWLAIGSINRFYYYMAKTQTPSQCFTAPWATQTGSIYNSGNFAINWYGYGWPILRSSC